jgi:glycine/D-amino acid oxidase-like deaminating enzyme
LHGSTRGKHLSSADLRTIIVGGGIMGLSTAIWLLRAGQKVTLVDPGIVGRPASYGNAGVLAACSVAPVTMPGLLGKGLLLALDPSSPLFLRWSYLPRLAPWLAKYLSYANWPEAQRISRALAPLLRDTYAQHRALSDGTDAARWVRATSYLFAYPSRAAFEAEGDVWRLRREAGFAWQEIEGPALRELDPALGPSIGFGVLVGDHGIIQNPGNYISDLRDHARSLGAEVIASEVNDFAFASDGSVRAVITEQGAIAGDRVVIATGAWSKTLTAKLGLDVPLETERGYHLMLLGTSIAPRYPTMVAAGKFVATPMADGVRCAGVIEFGGLAAGKSRRPLELIRSRLKDAFPTLTFKACDEWLGHRPAPADSIPLIGPVPGHRGVFLAFGHHHVGLTSGPKTGRLLATMILGATPELDMAPYAPARFARG